jgi:hypothetical protein
MSYIKVIFLTTVIILLAGCAHSITVSPDLTNINNHSENFDQTSIDVAYHIPPELLSLEVTTPGGGGDNVRYFPYRDIEAGYERALNNVFSSVVNLTATPDFSRVKKQGIDYVIQPQLVTSSGSTGFFTWPPTNFTVDLTSNVRDASGKVVFAPRVVGVGVAETAERLREHGIAGERAMEDALTKMQASLRDLQFEPRSQDTLPRELNPSLNPSIAARLLRLKALKERELLTQGEYEAKRSEILESL